MFRGLLVWVTALSIGIGIGIGTGEREMGAVYECMHFLRVSILSVLVLCSVP